MTDKQIIIDDVDVSVQECIFWQEGHCDCYHCADRYPHCLDFPNCYFKQLACKTQECEELKEENKRLVGTIANHVFDDFEELDRYRKALEAFQDDYFKGLDTTTIAELAKKSIRLTTENRKLETALEEIEEYQKRNCKFCFFAKTEKCNSSCRVFVIRGIINKAKGEGYWNNDK